MKKRPENVLKKLNDGLQNSSQNRKAVRSNRDIPSRTKSKIAESPLISRHWYVFFLNFLKIFEKVGKKPKLDFRNPVQNRKAVKMDKN